MKYLVFIFTAITFFGLPHSRGDGSPGGLGSSGGFYNSTTSGSTTSGSTTSGTTGGNQFISNAVNNAMMPVSPSGSGGTCYDVGSGLPIPCPAAQGLTSGSGTCISSVSGLSGPCPVSPGSNGDSGASTGADKSQEATCQSAMRRAVTECSSSAGMGGAAASMLQSQVGALIQQQQMNQMTNQENQAANSLTVITVNGQPQPAPGANSACNAVKALGGVNVAAGLLQGTFCYQAHGNCVENCFVNDPVQANMQNQCDSALHMFEAQVIPQAAMAMVTSMTGANCGAATATAANANPPPMTNPPAMPPVNQPANAGLSPFAAGSPAGAAFPAEGGTGGGSALGSAGYPGSPDKAGGDKAKDGSGINNPAMGFYGGAGGPGFSGSGGGGQMANGKGEPNLDFLKKFLPDAERKPAGMTEVTGANDLTNFQKVTRAMNKKRPVLKSGDGA